MYNEGSYKAKSDKAIFLLERECKKGNITEQEYKRAKETILDAQTNIIKEASTYSVAGAYLKMVMHDDDMSMARKLAELDESRNAMRRADEAIKENMEILQETIPGFTIARTDAEMYKVATELSYEYSIYGKVLQVKGLEAEKELEEVMSASENTRRDFEAAMESCVFDKIPDTDRSISELMHTPSMDRLIDTVSFGKVQAGVFPKGDYVIYTLPEKVLEEERMNPDQEAKDVMGFFDVIRKNGQCEQVNIKLTYLKDIGYCLSAEHYKDYLEQIGKVMTVQVKDGRDLGRTWSDGGIPVTQEQLKGLSPMSLMKLYGYNLKDDEQQRRAVLEYIFRNGEKPGVFPVPVSKEYIEKFFDGMQKLWANNKNFKNYIGIVEADHKFVKDLDPRTHAQAHHLRKAKENNDRDER